MQSMIRISSLIYKQKLCFILKINTFVSIHLLLDFSFYFLRTSSTSYLSTTSAHFSYAFTILKVSFTILHTYNILVNLEDLTTLFVYGFFQIEKFLNLTNVSSFLMVIIYHIWKAVSSYKTCKII